MSRASLKSLVPAEIRVRLGECFAAWRERFGSLRRLFVRPPFPRNPDGRVYVHLGCGRINHPKFINVDLVRREHVHYVCSVERLPMFEDNSVDLIYCAHCLEHISHLDTLRVLREWCRVLKPGGILRLSVPDFDRIIAIYEASGRKIDIVKTITMGGQGYPYNFHKAIFNREYLASLLAQAGFVNPRPWEPGMDELTTFEDWSEREVRVGDKRFPVSLNIEAQKAFVIGSETAKL